MIFGSRTTKVFASTPQEWGITTRCLVSPPKQTECRGNSAGDHSTHLNCTTRCRLHSAPEVYCTVQATELCVFGSSLPSVTTFWFQDNMLLCYTTANPPTTPPYPPSRWAENRECVFWNASNSLDPEAREGWTLSSFQIHLSLCPVRDLLLSCICCFDIRHFMASFQGPDQINQELKPPFCRPLVSNRFMVHESIYTCFTTMLWST